MTAERLSADTTSERVPPGPVDAAARLAFEANFPSNRTRKAQLLELCARIGFTPHIPLQHSRPSPTQVMLEAITCHRNMRS